MNTHAKQTPKNKDQSTVIRESQVQSSRESTSQFIDNRPEAVAQRQMQETANSQQVSQLKAFQDMANNSPQVKQATQFQALADSNHAKSQRSIQKKQNKTGLPDNLKIGVENLSGHSMDDVKVHYNSDKPAQLQAHAYAQGTDIHLGSGQEQHLPHEAWHVVQQKQGRVKPTMQMKGKVNVNDDVGLEKEADTMGVKALNTAFKPIPVMGELHSPTTNIVQRALDDSERAYLKETVGLNKTKILEKVGAEDIFKKFTKKRLEEMKEMNNERFTVMASQLKADTGSGGEDDNQIEESIETGGQVMESGGALIDVATEGLLSTVDAGLEGLGGGIAGVLDTRKGAQEAQKGGALKKVEGGSLAVSGMLGLADIAKDWAPEAANFIPGIGNYLSAMSGGAKMVSGLSQGINVKSNSSALEALKGDATAHTLIVEAVEILAGKLSYVESMKTTGLAALETGGGLLAGGAYKYGTTAVSKLAEPLMKLGFWGYGKMFGEGQEEREEGQMVDSASEKSVMTLAVTKSGTTEIGQKLLGRLYKLVHAIAPALAPALVAAGNALGEPHTTRLKDSFK